MILFKPSSIPNKNFLQISYFRTLIIPNATLYNAIDKEQRADAFSSLRIRRVDFDEPIK